MPSVATAGSGQQRRGGFGRLWRALKQLFHEIMGALFAIVALAWLSSAFRAWNRDAARWVMGLAALVTGLFVYFAVSSFRRARKL